MNHVMLRLIYTKCRALYLRLHCLHCLMVECGSGIHIHYRGPHKNLLFVSKDLLSSSSSVSGLLGSHGLAPSLPEARLSSAPAIAVKTKGRVLVPATPCICALTGGLFTSNCFNLLKQQKSRQVNGLSVGS